MWWFLQIIGILCIVIVHIFNRWAGMAGIDFYMRWLINISIQIVAAPAFIKSYALAPTFFQPWFLGTALIATAGFLGSLIFFGEAITIIKIIGSFSAVLGAILLIL